MVGQCGVLPAGDMNRAQRHEWPARLIACPTKQRDWQGMALPHNSYSFRRRALASRRRSNCFSASLKARVWTQRRAPWCSAG